MSGDVSISITETVRFAKSIVAIYMAVFIYTLQILMAVALVSGQFLSIIFLSDPIRLVKSYRLLPFPSPFSFSQTLKEMPQLYSFYEGLQMFITCSCLAWRLVKINFSFLSHSSESLKRLSVSLSVEFEQNTDNNMQYYVWC